MRPSSNPRYLIIADDLSGAADCAAGFAAAGLATSVLLEAGEAQVEPRSYACAEVLTVDTDSRRDEGRRSREKLLAVLKAHANGRSLIKKIDSTLRGGWAQEVATLHAVLGEIALVAPAFPAQGRTMQDGIVLVSGKRLAQTQTWQLEHADKDDRAAHMLAAAGLAVEGVSAEVLEAGVDAALDCIAQARQRGVQALVFDATVDTHLQTLAEASMRVTQAFSVCSAGLTNALAGLVSPRHGETRDVVSPSGGDLGGSVVTIVGSMSEIADRQLQFLSEQPHVRLHIVAPQLLRSLDPQEALQLVQSIQAEMHQGLDVVVRIGVDEKLDPAEGPLLAARLARLLRERLAHAAGLVITGGETARAVLQELGIHTLHVHSQSEPGVVLSFSDAPVAQWVATKAGAFGTPQSLYGASVAIHSVLRNGAEIQQRKHR